MTPAFWACIYAASPIVLLVVIAVGVRLWRRHISRSAAGQAAYRCAKANAEAGFFRPPTLLERFDALCEQLRSVSDVSERERLLSVFVTDSYWARISQDHDGPLPEVPPRRPSFAEAIAALTDEELDELQRDAEASGLAETFRRLKDCPGDGS